MTNNNVIKVSRSTGRLLLHRRLIVRFDKART